jgi:hypothetical protein
MKNLNKKEVEQAVLDYVTGGTSDNIYDMMGGYSDDVAIIIGNTIRDWENYAVDEEGPTAKQDKVLDSIIEDAATELMTL